LPKKTKQGAHKHPEALKLSNDVEAVTSEMTARKLFGYLHEGKI
jgi:hypothetical protein